MAISAEARRACSVMVERAYNDGVTVRHPHPGTDCHWCKTIQAAIDSELKEWREVLQRCLKDSEFDDAHPSDPPMLTAGTLMAIRALLARTEGMEG